MKMIYFKKILEDSEKSLKIVLSLNFITMNSNLATSRINAAFWHIISPFERTYRFKEFNTYPSYIIWRTYLFGYFYLTNIIQCILCVRSYWRHFININPINPHNNLLKWVLKLHLFHRWRTRGTEVKWLGQGHTAARAELKFKPRPTAPVWILYPRCFTGHILHYSELH